MLVTFYGSTNISPTSSTSDFKIIRTIITPIKEAFTEKFTGSTAKKIKSLVAIWEKVCGLRIAKGVLVFCRVIVNMVDEEGRCSWGRSICRRKKAHYY
jgi:hypothetical protein